MGKAKKGFLWAVTVLLTAGVGHCPGYATAKNGDGPPPATSLRAHPPHTDHSTLFHEPFADGPAVTRACLECHPDSARQVMATSHWNWEGPQVTVPGHDRPMRIGKRNVINNFCIGVQSNWPACTQCHIGYGWEDQNFDFNDPTRVDCLVCHDNSGTYVKKSQGAGLPDDTVDLLAAARSVGMPRRQNCGSCHFLGGGGNAVKHGDMDMTLLFPSARIDVHMGKNDMLCVDCHLTREHQIAGQAISLGVDQTSVLQCTSCHGASPHADVRINSHTARVACETCHIPFMAVDAGTKMTWDWSQAGQDLDITDQHVYLKIKGRFTWAKQVQPEYYWYNLTSTRYILGDKIDPSTPTRLTGPQGSRDDPRAQVWPFKVHRGKQPYDTVNKYFLVPNVHGEAGFWTQFDWPKALELGSQVTGLPYSGFYDFAPTEMYWPLTHMVTPSDRALQCRDCHGERGRLDWKALGYATDPLQREPVEHPPIYLFDENSEPVVSSGEAVSISASCGMCHELDASSFADSHGYHSSVEDSLLPAERRPLMVYGPRIPRDDASQMNCFLCHIDQPNHQERLTVISDGHPEWSITATLVGTGLVTREGDGSYRWNRDRVGDDGEAELHLRPVREQNCGACHGVVHNGANPLFIELGSGKNEDWTTEKTGQVFSPQRVRLSAMNLRDKDKLDLAWDVHSERLVSCGDCHYSRGRPQRLAGEAKPADVEPTEGVRRRCESCHSISGTHDWLPEADRHFRAVACESCHVPELEMAAQQSLDQTVIHLDGRPGISYRGLQGTDLENIATAFIQGYRPLLRVGLSARGEHRVLPYNLVTEWYWADGEHGEPLPSKRLRAAWLDGDSYRPEILEAFDANRDGRLDDAELRLDNYAKVVLIKERLRQAGVENPSIRGEIRAYHIHHNVRHGDRVNRDCAVCHPENKEDVKPFKLAPFVPGGVKPVLMAEPSRIALDGEWGLAEDGALVFRPASGVADSYRALENPREKK